MDTFLGLIRRHRALSAVLVLGLLASLTYAFYFQVRVAVDAKAYDSIAWSLVQGTGYTETTSQIPNSSVGRLGPGYEFFLATWYFIFGHQIWIIWIVQSLLHVGSGFLIYRIIRELLSSDTPEIYAVAGAAFYLFFIDVLEFPAMLMAETLYLFLVILGTLLSIFLWRKTTMRHAVVVSAIFSLTVLVRTPALLLVFLTFGFLAYYRHWRSLAWSIAVCVIILTPWTIRNWIVYHRIIPTSAILGYDLWVGNNLNSRYPGELTASEEIDRYSAEYGLFATNERGIQEVLKFAQTKPIELIGLQIKKLSIYFSTARPAAFWFHLSGSSRAVTAVFSSLFSFALFVFGLAGLWRYLFRTELVSRMVVLFTLAAPAGVIWIVAETRYRYQIYPMLIVLGALFLYEFLKDKKAHWKVLVISFVLVTANTTIDVMHNSSRVFDRIEGILRLL